MTNVTEGGGADGGNGGWVTFFLVMELTTCMSGAFGSLLSLWCSWHCKKTKPGMKVHFFLFFSLIFIICLVVMPMAVVEENLSLRGLQTNRSIRVAFVGLHTIFGNLERNVFAVIAIYRLIAVIFPLQYKFFSQSSVAMTIQACVCTVVLILWVPPFFIQNFDDVDPGNASSYKMGHTLYYVTLLMPIVITATAYFVLALTIVLRKRPKLKREGETSFERRLARLVDPVTLGVGSVILVNLLLDVPHIAIHFRETPSTDLLFVAIHVIYRLHFTLDPFLFVVLNRYYRRRVQLLFQAWLSCRLSPPPELVSDPLTSLHGQLASRV